MQKYETIKLPKKTVQSYKFTYFNSLNLIISKYDIVCVCECVVQHVKSTRFMLDFKTLYLLKLIKIFYGE